MKQVKVKNIVFNEGLPKICVPITGTTENEILEEFTELKNIDSDLIELRIDYFEHVLNEQSVINLLNKIKKINDKPMIFTLRSKGEGGIKDFADEYYFSLNNKVVEGNLADLIDIEFFKNEKEVKTIINEAKKNEIKIILSNHEFLKTPAKEEISLRLNKMADYGADIPKIAVMTDSPEDVLMLLEASIDFKKENKSPFIAIAMGPLGIVTRIACNLSGSCMTYASFKNSSAPGQLNVKLIKELLEIMG